MQAIGSSPRLWGTLLVRARSHCLIRFIPTPVGNTSAITRPDDQLGSSPRLWGTRRPVRCADLRFIPTPVGNTHLHQLGQARSGSSPRLWGTLVALPGHYLPVHPHACGEHRFAGTPSGIDRFIPTPVGNTVLIVLCSHRPPVHPHACGEHFPGAGMNAESGSSPRLWGTRSR